MKHPECRSGEVFIGNADEESFSKIGWRTKRKGTTAYLRSGKAISSEWPGAFPVFVKMSEVQGVSPAVLAALDEMNEGNAYNV